MKIRLTQDAFSDVVARAQSILERKSSRPILENILLEARNGELVVGATDLRVSLTQTIPCEIEEGGSISLHGRRLHEIVREAPKGEIVLESKENQWVTITAGKSVFHVPGIAADDFPTIPAPAENFLKISSKVFDEMVSKTVFAASNDESRIYLCGVFLQEAVNDKSESILRMVATDGHRLSLMEKPLQSGLGLFSKGVIIPKKGVAELRNLASIAGEDLEIAHGGGKLYGRAKNLVLSITLIDASFPNYQQVIPEGGHNGVLIDCAKFRDALRRVSILSDQETRSVMIEVDKGTMSLRSDNPSLGDAKELLDVDYDGATMKVAFNANYVMEILKVMSDPSLRMEVKDSLSPALFLGTDKDAHFLSVVMPMRID